MSEAIAEFVAVTGCPQSKAEQYLRICDNNLEHALQLFFDGVEIDAPSSSTGFGTGGRSQPIPVDDDEEADIQQAIRSSRLEGGGSDVGAGFGDDFEDDEAMARRLQEELNASINGVRAPIARTRETLVGPEDDFIRRNVASARGPRPGIFNQRVPSAWDPESSEATRRRALAEATGGASDVNAKSNRLAELFRPPYEIMSHFDLSEAREEGRDQEKWIMVNIQEQGNFQCQALNRDIWKAKEVIEAIKENFIFLQYDRDGPDGMEYVRLYMPHAQNIPRAAQTSPFPHIAIIDPRTGEKVKEWHDPPQEAMSFVMDVHDFLTRFSLSEDARNPVAAQGISPKIVDVDNMTEEEMLRIAMQNSLEGASDLPVKTTKRKKDDTESTDLIDIDASDRPSPKRTESTYNASHSTPAREASAFANISAIHHDEPPANATGVTRIQFRFHDGSRVVRRFLLGDGIQRIYEWLKADLIPAKFPDDISKDFELVSMGTKLIEHLGETVEQAGLRNGTVMVAVESDD